MLPKDAFAPNLTSRVNVYLYSASSQSASNALLLPVSQC